MAGKEPLEKDQYEKFIQLVVSGQKKRDAYKEAFGVTKSNSAGAAASRIFRRPEVQARYIYLMQQAGKKAEKEERERTKQHHAKVTKNEVCYETKVNEADVSTDARAEIIKKWSDIARADYTDYFTIQPNPDDPKTVLAQLKNMKELPPELRIAIKEIRWDKNGNPNLILYDRMAALDKLSAFYKLTEDDGKDKGTAVDLSDVPGDYNV